MSPGTGAHLLDRDHLADHVDLLFRIAWALCGSQHDAEDLVQETFAKVLKRPRLVRGDTDVGYLVRALKNTHASWYRGTRHQRNERPLLEDQTSETVEESVSSRELMEAIASAPAAYRDAVIAVDLVGLSYREAAESLGVNEGTLTSRLHRGRQHVAGMLVDEVPVGR